MANRLSSFQAEESAQIVEQAINDSAFDTVQIVADNIADVQGVGAAISEGIVDKLVEVSSEPLKSAVFNVESNVIHIDEVKVEVDTALELTEVALAGAQSAQLATEEVRDKLYELTVEEGDVGSEVEYNGVDNILTIPRGVPGVNGVDGMTPVFDITQDGTELVVSLTGYMPSTDVPSEEW